MARKKIIHNSNQKFIENLSEYSNPLLTEVEKVNIAKKSYLYLNKEDILKAVMMGYPYKYIAEYATVELLKKDIPKTFTYKNKEGEEVEGVTQITPMNVKDLCEDK